MYCGDSRVCYIPLESIVSFKQPNTLVTKHREIMWLASQFVRANLKKAQVFKSASLFSLSLPAQSFVILPEHPFPLGRWDGLG